MSLLFADDDVLVALSVPEKIGYSLQMRGKTLPLDFKYLETLVMEKQCVRLTN